MERDATVQQTTKNAIQFRMIRSIHGITVTLIVFSLYFIHCVILCVIVVVVTDDQNKYANKSALCESTDIVLSYRPCSRTSIYLNSISRFGRYYLTEEQRQTEAFLICLPKRYWQKRHISECEIQHNSRRCRDSLFLLNLSCCVQAKGAFRIVSCSYRFDVRWLRAKRADCLLSTVDFDANQTHTHKQENITLSAHKISSANDIFPLIIFQQMQNGKNCYRRYKKGTENAKKAACW